MRSVPMRPGGPRPSLVDNWRLFALAALIEEKERAICEAATERAIIERIRMINPVMVKNVERSM